MQSQNHVVKYPERCSAYQTFDEYYWPVGSLTTTCATHSSVDQSFRDCILLGLTFSRFAVFSKIACNSADNAAILLKTVEKLYCRTFVEE